MDTEKGFVPAKVHPSYLETNAQHHLWPFSAIAELIDNAYDPDVSADLLKINVEKKHGKTCLTFTDNGNGADLDHMIKMLSLGFCEKEKFKDAKDYHSPVGRYGNGFKSGSMRLAKDALVFTVHKTTETACIGLLSQTLCSDRHLESLEFPMMEYTMPNLKRSEANLAMDKALEAILDVSPYNSEDELLAELSTLRKQKKRSGTKIVLFNLNRQTGGTFELDFQSDPEDIRNPDDQSSVTQQTDGTHKLTGYRQSLRRYCSILFRVSKMDIEIHGKRVDHFYFLGDLKSTTQKSYRPRGKERPVEIVIGREKKTGSGKLEDHGVLFYHRNRLIKPFVKLPCQLKRDGQAIGTDVVAVVDVTDVLKPIHNKQDFEVNTLEYRNVIKAVNEKVIIYCENGEEVTSETESVEIKEDTDGNSDWVQCQHCKKWRRLPAGIPKPGRKWYCFMNPDLTKNRCEIPQENRTWDETEIRKPTSPKKRKSSDAKRRIPTKCSRGSSDGSQPSMGFVVPEAPELWPAGPALDEEPDQASSLSEAPETSDAPANVEATPNLTNQDPDRETVVILEDAAIIIKTPSSHKDTASSLQNTTSELGDQSTSSDPLPAPRGKPPTAAVAPHYRRASLASGPSPDQRDTTFSWQGDETGPSEINPGPRRTVPKPTIFLHWEDSGPAWKTSRHQRGPTSNLRHRISNERKEAAGSKAPNLTPVQNQRSDSTTLHSTENQRNEPALVETEQTSSEPSSVRSIVQELTQRITRFWSGSRTSPQTSASTEPPSSLEAQGGDEHIRGTVTQNEPGREKDRGEKFRWNVHQLLLYMDEQQMLGMQTAGRLDAVDETVRQVLKSLRLPFK